MWLDGDAIDADTTYQVAANSFLASGTGDNFFAFAEAINKRDSGKVDLAGDGRLHGRPSRPTPTRSTSTTRSARSVSPASPATTPSARR